MEATKTILLVEEKGDWRDLLIHVIERCGYNVIVLTEPQAIGEAMRVHPDLIWFDLDLLGSSGESLLAQLHADPSAAHIPIICEATYGDHHEFSHLLLAGAREVLYKPFDLTDLPSILRSNL
jgi:DNA-binding response OmpR family regulator